MESVLPLPALNSNRPFAQLRWRLATRSMIRLWVCATSPCIYVRGTDRDYARKGGTRYPRQDWQSRTLTSSLMLYSGHFQCKREGDVRWRLNCTRSTRNGSDGRCMRFLRQSVWLFVIGWRVPSVVCDKIAPTSNGYCSFLGSVVHELVLLIVLNKDIGCRFELDQPCCGRLPSRGLCRCSLRHWQQLFHWSTWC